MLGRFKLKLFNWFTYASPKQKYSWLKWVLIGGTIISVATVCAFPTLGGFKEKEEKPDATKELRTDLDDAKAFVKENKDLITEAIKDAIPPTPEIDYEKLITKATETNIDRLFKEALQEAMDLKAIAKTTEELEKVDAQFLDKVREIEERTGLTIVPNTLPIPTPTPLPPPVLDNEGNTIIIPTPTPDPNIIIVPTIAVVTPTPTPIASNKAAPPKLAEDTGLQPETVTAVEDDYLKYNIVTWTKDTLEVDVTINEGSGGMPEYAQLWVTNSSYTDTPSCSSEAPYFFIRNNSFNYASDITVDYSTDICLDEYRVTDVRNLLWFDALWDLSRFN